MITTEKSLSRQLSDALWAQHDILYELEVNWFHGACWVAADALLERLRTDAPDTPVELYGAYDETSPFPELPAHFVAMVELAQGSVYLDANGVQSAEQLLDAMRALGMRDPHLAACDELECATSGIFLRSTPISTRLAAILLQEIGPLSPDRLEQARKE